MKATGVVRRIDDLGRIVIPKEIRRNFKINEGDSIEIFVDNNGIILKKYSLLDDMVELSSKLVELVYKVYGKSIFVTDKEKVIAVSKNFEKNYLSKELSGFVKENIDKRSEVTMAEGFSIISSEKLSYASFFCPMIVNSDSLGSIILVDQEITEEDKNLTRFIASILVKNLED